MESESSKIDPTFTELILRTEYFEFSITEESGDRPCRLDHKWFRKKKEIKDQGSALGKHR